MVDEKKKKMFDKRKAKKNLTIGMRIMGVCGFGDHIHNAMKNIE
jgi:hypothetical protein